MSGKSSGKLTLESICALPYIKGAIVDSPDTNDEDSWVSDTEEECPDPSDAALPRKTEEWVANASLAVPTSRRKKKRAEASDDEDNGLQECHTQQAAYVRPACMHVKLAGGAARPTREPTVSLTYDSSSRRV